jgi:hypothetical protein
MRTHQAYSSYVPPSYEWRGAFENKEVNALHAEAFNTRLYTDQEWNWEDLLANHSLGWVTARVGARLVGFVNVVWDGKTHSWVQDTMVARNQRHRRIGTEMLALVRLECQKTRCEWLHVDFDDGLEEFYLRSCGFRPTRAGLIPLTQPSG